MFVFAEGYVHFQRIGVLLLMVQLALFAFGLPPGHVGIWLQTEPDMLALYALGMANAVWLMYGVGRRALVQVKGPVLWWWVLAWVLWQMVPTVLSFSPWRSWYGPVEMGEGVGWHVCLLLVMMVSYPLWQVRSYRNVLLIWAAGVISLESLLHVLFNARDNFYVPGRWTPAQWGAYLAYMVGYFWIMVMAGGYVRSPALFLALMAFTADVFVISYNKTGIALLPFAMLTSFYMFMRQKKRGGETPPLDRRWRYAAVALCFVPIAWVVFSAAYQSPITEEED
ncbi:MAG: hypothetical protein K2Q01_00120, partial [Rickettsiales bacterium]|nr:hypothetical protein [Rickettsiales bacterium]